MVSVNLFADLLTGVIVIIFLIGLWHVSGFILKRSIIYFVIIILTVEDVLVSIFHGCRRWIGG